MSPAHEAQWRQFLDNQHVHRFVTGPGALAKTVAADLQADHSREVLLVHAAAAKANGKVALTCCWQLPNSLSQDAMRDCTVKFPVKKQCLNTVCHYAASKTQAHGRRRDSTLVRVGGVCPMQGVCAVCLCDSSPMPPIIYSYPMLERYMLVLAKFFLLPERYAHRKAVAEQEFESKSLKF